MAENFRAVQFSVFMVDSWTEEIEPLENTLLYGIGLIYPSILIWLRRLKFMAPLLFDSMALLA